MMVEKKQKNRYVILCVDDEQLILRCIKTQLKETYGDFFIYETAENAMDALEIIDEVMDDKSTNLIVISDWLMPVLKGDEFLIKVHQSYPQAIKIMLTGLADLKAIERSRKEANLFRCLSKPWSKPELLASVESSLSLFDRTNC